FENPVRRLSYSSQYGVVRQPRATDGGVQGARPAGRRRRIPTVDVVRGVLMTLIICTHALSNVDPKSGGTALRVVRMLLSGTVGLATVWGMLVGYFLVAKSGELARVFRGYAVRAVVLTIVAHPLISIALHGPVGDASLLDFMARTIYVTDVLA